MNVNRDALDRLQRLGLKYYVTGSTALAQYAEPRMTRDMDVVVDSSPVGYERRIRPAFEDAYLVADLVHTPMKALGSVIHRTELAKADLILRFGDRWARAAMDRRLDLDDPVLGRTWFSTAEDLLLAKLEWSEGGRSELQLRDCQSLVRLNPALDWPYVERYASLLGVTDLVRNLRGG